MGGSGGGPSVVVVVAAAAVCWFVGAVGVVGAVHAGRLVGVWVEMGQGVKCDTVASAVTCSLFLVAVGPCARTQSRH
jgi:hypothetical protein